MKDRHAKLISKISQ